MGVSENWGYLILGVLIIRILLCRVLYQGSPISETPKSLKVKQSGPGSGFGLGLLGLGLGRFLAPLLEAQTASFRLRLESVEKS